MKRLSAPICVVAPYPELASLADQVVREMGSEMAVAVGDLHYGLDAARAAVAAGTEILVSRGGTALLLRRHLSTPVVEIGVTAYDLLRCLASLPPGFGGKISIVGFGNVIDNAELLGRLLHLEIDCTTLSEGAGVHSVLAEAVKAGVDLIIGDAVTVRIAQEMGLSGLLITSGHEAILQALQEAQRLLYALRQERKRVAELKAILDSSHDAIVAVDQDNLITMFNRKAAQLFGTPSEEAVLGRPAAAALVGHAGAGFVAGDELLQGQVFKVGDAAVLVNRVPINEVGRPMGAVTTFRDVTELQNAEQKVRRELHAKGLTAKQRLDDITTASPAILRTVQMAERFAGSDSTVLIQGESGTGKELFAQGLHNASPRKAGPFVAVNCAAIPESLLESELFGYAEGAFTGAARGGRPGLFELAHRGTIFLDEIGEMPFSLQSRLLRVLQEREVMRVGGDRVIPINVRFIAATNRALEEEVAAGRFRQDLYYRLNILMLRIPPLRERPEDVPLLLALFLERLARRTGKPMLQLEGWLEAALTRYPWPGNVRELIGVAERLDLLAGDGKLDPAAISDLVGMVRPELTESAQPETPRAHPVQEAPLHGTLEEITQRIVGEVLAAEGGNLSRAARRLGIDRTTLWRRLRR